MVMTNGAILAVLLCTRKVGRGASKKNCRKREEGLFLLLLFVLLLLLLLAILDVCHALRLCHHRVLPRLPGPCPRAALTTSPFYFLLTHPWNTLLLFSFFFSLPTPSSPCNNHFDHRREYKRE